MFYVIQIRPQLFAGMAGMILGMNNGAWMIECANIITVLVLVKVDEKTDRIAAAGGKVIYPVPAYTLVAPEERPSVTMATEVCRPIPTSMAAGMESSRIPGPPLGPS